MKKSATYDEYVVLQRDDNSIIVYRIFNNVKASLRNAADVVGFEFDEGWNTRQFGKNLCKKFGDGESCEIGNYFIKVLPSGSIETYLTYEQQAPKLRDIAEKVGFQIDPKWNTRTLGSKLIDVLNAK